MTNGDTGNEFWTIVVLPEGIIRSDSCTRPDTAQTPGRDNSLNDGGKVVNLALRIVWNLALERAWILPHMNSPKTR
jgi:hypothetical protein